MFSVFGFKEQLSKIYDTIYNNRLLLMIVGGLLLSLVRHIIINLWKLGKSLPPKLSQNKRFQKDYINWIINTSKYVSSLPSTFAAVKSGTLHQMELDEIYINLTMSQGEDAGKTRSLDDVISTNNRIIVLGDPGSGKSTMMQYLTLQSAYAFSGQKKKKSLNLKKRFPILIQLNKFHDITGWEKDKSLLTAISDEIEANLGRTIPKGFLDKRLKEGKVLLLLDAFDELASTDARQLLAQKVRYFASSYPENQFIITSRITGYNNQLANAGFAQSCTIKELTAEIIKSYINRWYENLARGQSIDKQQDEKDYLSKQYKKRAQTLIDVIISNDRIRELAINPMLLSLIALIHYVKVKLPEQRHLLYRECVDILVELWDNFKSVKFPMLDELSVNEKKQILQRIAYYMQEHQLKTILKSEIIETVLREAWREICGEKIKGSESELNNFLNLVEERTGLIVEKGFDEQGLPLVSFSHLTFQEYLASLEILSSYKTDEEAFSRILEDIENDTEWWKEVALLTLSQFKNPLAYQKKLFQMIPS